MKMSQPLGNELYGPLFVRCALGLYLLVAGLAKLTNLEGFIEVVKAYNILTGQAVMLYAVLVPFLEVGCGALLVIGMWTTLASIVSAACIASYLFALGLFTESGYLLNKDVVFFAAACSLMYSGAGAFSIDRFRQNS
jgi:uncharacterized membrane protein YphA (DoxX/SURF4 family)